jgi:hypothetical protein
MSCPKTKLVKKGREKEKNKTKSIDQKERRGEWRWKQEKPVKK